MNSPAADLKLKPIDAPGLPKFIDVPEDGLSIGRDPANAVVLDGERYPYTSSYHARVSLERDALIIEDLQSKNGTLVNGRKVEREKLKAGDIVQLGREIGARFLVVSPTSVAETVDIRGSTGSEPRGDMSVSTVVRLKKVLGIPEDADSFRDLVRTGHRRAVVTALVLFVVLAVFAVWGFVYIVDRQRVEIAALRGINQALEESLSRFTDELAKKQQARTIQIAALEAEKDRLIERIEALRRSGEASAGSLRELRRRLDDTNVRLEQYNPLNLEKEEEGLRKKLARVLASIAYIEKKIAFREKDGDRYLHDSGTPGQRLREAGDREDLFFDMAASGSGFCVSAEGWVVTNAHVVKVPEVRRPLRYGATELVMEPVLDVIFSGTSTRHRARIVSVSEEGDDDFALLKIEPFEGMPWVEDFRVDVELPSPGSEVRLFGFPLGKILLQEKDSYTASVFAGIVSRRADPYIQVQASVYPGNSGGPAVDEEARVIGIVTGVQTVPGGQIASDIGFVLPISRLKKIWPPPDDAKK